MRRKCVVIKLCFIFLFMINLHRLAAEEDLKKIEESSKHFNQGVNYYIQRDYKNASNEWLKALLLNPGEIKIKKYFDKSQKKFYQSQIYFYDGLKFFKQAMYEKAKEKFKNALLISPRDEKARYYLKLCYTPIIEMRTGTDFFSMRGRKNSFEIKVDKSLTVDNWIKEWNLDISRIEGKKIRNLKGKGCPKTIIKWDLRDNSGKVIAERKVKYYMQLKSIYGRVIQSKTNKIFVDNYGPDIDVTVNTNFYPDDTRKNKVKFEIEIKDRGTGVKDWWVEIYNNKKGEIIKKLSSRRKEGRSEIIWDGSLNSGEKVTGGSTIYYSVIAYDKASNQSKTKTRRIEAKISLKRDRRGLVINLPNIEFDFGKATLKKSSYPILDKVGEILLNYKDAKFIIEGHTDDIGSEKKNLVLSQKRAESVYRYLSEKFGISENRVKVKGYGESRPLVPNVSKANRRKNRRVEIIIKNE